MGGQACGWTACRSTIDLCGCGICRTNCSRLFRRAGCWNFEQRASPVLRVSCGDRRFPVFSHIMIPYHAFWRCCVHWFARAQRKFGRLLRVPYLRVDRTRSWAERVPVG